MASKEIELEKIKELGLISSKEIQKRLKISQPTLSRLVKSGAILKLSHGIYTHSNFEIPPEDLDFAIACAKFGNKSAIGGLSALFHYGLIDQAPSQVWIIVSPDKADNNKLYRSMRTKTTLKFGIDSFKTYRITNIERSIIEALKFGEKIGLRVVIGAARTALKNGLTTEKKLGEMAYKLKLRSVLEKYWESIII